MLRNAIRDQLTPATCTAVFSVFASTSRSQLPSCQRVSPVEQSRSGISRPEVLILVAAAGLLVSLLAPWILSARESLRRASCQANIQQLGVGLQMYHDTYRKFPPAAVWSTTELRSLSIHHSRRIDLFTHNNWARMVLAFAGEEVLARQFDPDLPIASVEHRQPRNVRLPLMTCPSDSYNRDDNAYLFELTNTSLLSFARGNYAINGGSHCFREEPGTAAFLAGDGAHLLVDTNTRDFQLWGNGIAGFNVSFSMKNFTNGASTFIALDELRAGIHPTDPRGVWSLGQIGGSITWSHGVNGDAFGPNNQHPRSDDILGCGHLHEVLGSTALQKAQMPCVSYINQNFQATSRSMHPNGVNVLYLDGAAKFVSDAIDPGLWHALHSRETPQESLAGGIGWAIEGRCIAEKAASELVVRDSKLTPLSVIENSIGMQFSLIPAGEFTMGLPDQSQAYDVPSGMPPHQVRLTRPYFLGRYEVTQMQYTQLMNDGKGHAITKGRSSEDFAMFPATNVSWHQAAEFCSRLSALPAERHLNRRYRLPTEAEWEYACRAGSEKAYNWTKNRLADDGSGDASGILPALPLQAVGTYRPNAFGLYDMRGNAWEWNADWFDSEYYRRSPVDDPQGPQSGFIKVVRGSDWTFVGEGCKIHYPVMPPFKRSAFVGFRVVCEVVDTTVMADETVKASTTEKLFDL